MSKEEKDQFYFLSEFNYELIHRPSKNNNDEPLTSTFGVKFCEDIFINESLLKKWNIKYQSSELEKTPYGLCARIKKNEKSVKSFK